MTASPLRAAFVAMAREEWRLHGRLFGGRRFGAFPAFVFATVAGGVALLTVVDVRLEEVVVGAHLLVFLFGLHTGSIGFVGRDALRNLFGDVTFVVFAARTLPVRRGTLLLVFLAKDVAYYGALFLVPMAVGIAPALVAAEYDLVAGVWYVWWLWISLGATFLLGLVVTLVAIGLTARGLRRLGVAAIVAVVAAAAWWLELDPLAVTPLGVFLGPDPGRLVGTAVLIIGLATAAAITFSPLQRSRTRRRAPRVRRWMTVVRDPVATRTLLEVHRSAGGVWKLLVSGAILFAVGVGLLAFASTVTGVEPARGSALGAILGLAGFTTYNWLTQGDDARGYLVQPLSLEDVIRGKARAFALAAPTVAMPFYLGGWAWYGLDHVDGVVGVAVMLGVTWYTFGLTVFLAGLWPNEFLYDTTLFAALWLALGAALVPVLVVSLALSPLPTWLAGALVTAALGLAGIGSVLARAGARRWSRRYQATGAPSGR
ncbi:MAG: hypothetical protein ACLFM8_01720 [Halobacteriales archaeon]